MYSGGRFPPVPPAPEMSEAEKLARKFHDTYERLAPQFGYETRTETRQFDPATPNGQLMIAVCGEILKDPEVSAASVFAQMGSRPRDSYVEQP